MRLTVQSDRGWAREQEGAQKVCHWVASDFWTASSAQLERRSELDLVEFGRGEVVRSVCGCTIGRAHGKHGTR